MNTIAELTLARLWEAHASFASSLQEDGDLRGWVQEILRRQKAFADLCLTALPALLDERVALLAELDGAHSECLRLESELGAAQSELDAARRALQKESE